MMPRTLVPTNPSPSLDMMMGNHNNTPGGRSSNAAMDDLLDRLQNASPSSDTNNNAGGLTKSHQFEHKQIPQGHNVMDLDRIHHGPQDKKQLTEELKKPQKHSRFPGKKGPKEIVLEKKQKTTVGKGGGKPPKKSRRSSTATGDDVIALKKVEPRTISAVPSISRSRVSKNPRSHAWDADAQGLPEVDTLAGETATMTKTTGSSSKSPPHVGSRGLFRSKKHNKLHQKVGQQQQNSKKNKKAGKAKSMLSSVLRLDEEEVEEGFQSAKIRQGIEMARKSQSAHQSWKTPYEIDAPRTITIHTRTAKTNNDNNSNNNLEQLSEGPDNAGPKYLPDKISVPTGIIPPQDSSSAVDDYPETDNESDARTTEQKIWDGIEILLSEAFSESGEGDTNSQSVRSHMSQLEDILPGQLLRAMSSGPAGHGGASSIGTSLHSKSSSHNNIIKFDSRDHSQSLWETLKHGSGGDGTSISTRNTNRKSIASASASHSPDEVGMAQVTLNSFMDLLVPDGDCDQDDSLEQEKSVPSLKSKTSNTNEIVNAEHALNNFMNALIGSLEEDLQKDPEKMSLDEQVHQIRKTQSTLTLFELFRWSLQVNVDATERTQFRATHPHIYHPPLSTEEEDVEHDTLQDPMQGLLHPVSSGGGGGTPPSQEPHDQQQHLQPLPSPPPPPPLEQQSSAVPSWAANIVMSAGSSPLQSSQQSRHGGAGGNNNEDGPLHHRSSSRNRLRSQSPTPSSYLSDSVLLPSSFVDGVNEIMQMSEEHLQNHQQQREASSQSRNSAAGAAASNGEMPELASISDESTSLPSYTGDDPEERSDGSSLSFATASNEEEEEGLKDGSIVLSQFGETPTISTTGGGASGASGQPASSLSHTFSGSREDEEEKVSEEEKMKEIAQEFPMVDHPSISSSSQNNLIASNMVVPTVAAAATAAAIATPTIKSKKKKSNNKTMKDPTKSNEQDVIPPSMAADLGNTSKDTSGYTTPYHTATTKRPQVVSAAGDVFSDDMSHHSLERFAAEFGPIDTTTNASKLKHTKSKNTKKDKMDGRKTKKQQLQQQKQQKSTQSKTRSMSRAGDIAVPTNTTVDIPHDPPESIDDDLTIDSVLKKDHERDPTNIDRSTIPKTKKNKYEKNKGNKNGFFGSWFSKSKGKVKEDGSSTKKSSSRGSGKKSCGNKKNTDDSVVPVTSSSKSQSAKNKRGNKRSTMTMQTDPTSSRRVAKGSKGVSWKREISTKSDACLMHEEESGYDEAPIIAP
eukprot:CAMPEP_0195282282 /NCGR_PEP_ID=MMETSP0707-20130614/1225_1 /TAXON_ID=33640 /ORGANISM="Asterionellopsis glacialis, Strain CCMP134" /LENGTH=1246 /DNA_ID=CAMNT_0040341239 /DNA_START=5 /DNA_END=3745 /DNA_ORIENTATION=-